MVREKQFIQLLNFGAFSPATSIERVFLHNGRHLAHRTAQTQLFQASSQAVPGSADGIPQSPWYFLVTVVTERAPPCCDRAHKLPTARPCETKPTAKSVPTDGCNLKGPKKPHRPVKLEVYFSCLKNHRANSQHWHSRCYVSVAVERGPFLRSNLALFTGDTNHDGTPCLFGNSVKCNKYQLCSPTCMRWNHKCMTLMQGIKH